MSLRGLLLALAGLLLLARPAGAACTTSTQSVAFGTYSPRGPTAADSVGSVTVTCTGLLQINVAYTVQIGGGVWGTVIDRMMASGGARLRYQLYLDPARQVIWGDDTRGTQAVRRQALLSVLGSGATHPIYGRLFASQNVPPGTYTDALQILVIY